MVGDWLFEDNHKPFVRMLTRLSGYTQDDEDDEWVAVEYGLQDTGEQEKLRSAATGGGVLTTLPSKVPPHADEPLP